MDEAIFKFINQKSKLPKVDETEPMRTKELAGKLVNENDFMC